MNQLNALQNLFLIFCFVLYYVLLYRFRNHKYLRWWKEWLEIVRNEENLKLRLFSVLILINILFFPVVVLYFLFNIDIQEMKEGFNNLEPEDAFIVAFLFWGLSFFVLYLFRNTKPIRWCIKWFRVIKGWNYLLGVLVIFATFYLPLLLVGFLLSLLSKTH